MNKAQVKVEKLLFLCMNHWEGFDEGARACIIGWRNRMSPKSSIPVNILIFQVFFALMKR